MLYLMQPQVIDFIFVFGANLLVVLAVPIIWGLLKDYQKQRLLIFLDPSMDPY